MRALCFLIIVSVQILLFYFSIFKLFYQIQLIYNVVLVSAVQEGESVVRPVQSVSHIQLFGIPWTAASQASLSQSLFKLMTIESVMPSNHISSVIPFSSLLQSFSASGSFPISQFFSSGGQNIGVSASASVLPMNIQDWFPLGWTGWISLQSKGISSIFNTTVQKHGQDGEHMHTHGRFMWMYGKNDHNTVK